MLGHARVRPPGEDPGTRRLGRLEKAFSQTPLESGLEFEVGLAPGDRDEELRLLQAPLSEEKGQHQLRLRVVGEPDILERNETEEQVNFQNRSIY